MNRRVDLLIVGAGPAGMSAAIVARRYGLDVLVVDEQGSPGGQIWRNIEANSSASWSSVLGSSYRQGGQVVGKFRESGADYAANTKVWHIEAGPRAYMTQQQSAFSVEARSLLLATGAQERPIPFPGWTLPGVMTVGAAQILLKTARQIPTSPVWIAGSGPLPLLYATQLLKAGGEIAGFLETTPRGRLLASAATLGKALFQSPGEVLKGVGWMAALKRNVRYIPHVTDIEAIGTAALEKVRYISKEGKIATVDASILLVHEGLVPTIHPTLALGCRHIWNVDQDCFAPQLDEWGETSEANVFVAGDGAGIGGAIAASLRGEIAALRIVARVGRLSDSEASTSARPLRLRLKQSLAVRPFLDRLYRPRPAIWAPEDETIVCRCEEVTASTIREMARIGCPGPDQVKAYTRVGMGPCQGRQCNYTIANLLATVEGRTVPDVGLYRVRPPIKPLTLAELASLDHSDASR